MFLQGKKLWDVVRGESTESDPEAQEIKELRARNIICLSLADNLLIHEDTESSPKEIWAKLEEIYEPKNLANKLFLRRKFFTLKMEDGVGMLAHINNVKALADQLKIIGAEIKEEDVVMTLLNSLNDDYAGLITALENKKPEELTLNFVTGRLLYEETKRKESGKGAMPAHEMVMNTKNVKKGAKKTVRSQIECFNCHKKGHYARDCFLKKKKNGDVEAPKNANNCL